MFINNRKSTLFNPLALIFLLISPLFLTLFLSNLFFLFKISLSGLTIFFSFIISYFILLSLTQKNHLYEWLITGIIYLLSYFLSIFFYDLSADGQWYHLESIINLYKGWNPIYEISKTNVAQIYVQSYPKGYEIIAASIYSFTQKMESGKLINMIVLIASLVYVFQLLKQTKLSIFKKYVYTFLICVNPIVITEIFTYYLDGFMFSCLLILICSFISLLKNYNKIELAIFIFILSVFSSLKFTSILLIFIFVLFALTLLWKNHKLTFKYLFPFFISGLFIFPLTNINPYYTNIKNNFHIFHPAFGKEKVKNLLSSHVSEEFYGKNRIEKAFISYFSYTGSSKKTINFKIPFSIKFSEIKVLNEVSITYGGFGPFFGGIIILTILLFIISLFIPIKAPPVLYYLMLGIMISIVSFPDIWFARMVPQLYLCTILTLLIMEYKSIKNIYLKFWTHLTSLIICINTFLFIIISLTLNFYLSLNIHYQISQLKKLEKNSPIPIDYFFKSNLTRLEENHIAYRVTQIPYSENNKNLHFFGAKGKNTTRFIAELNEKDKTKLLRYLDNQYNKIFNYYQTYKKN
jgi:hypothetical protein